MAIVIGIDVGTSGTKAVAIDAAGKLLASAMVEYPLQSPRPGWAEQDPEDWARAALQALKELAAEIEAGEVKGIGLTGQMHGSVFLDDKDQVIRPALLWCDQRTGQQCVEITRRAGGEERLIEMVSNPALTGFTAPKILWLREHEPEHFERVSKVLLPKDYVRFLLCGEYATDLSDASGTLLLDVKNRRWSDELLDLLEIPRDWMPEAYEGPEVTGQLSARVAEETGLPKGTPIVAGGGDNAAGGVGAGVVRPGVVTASLGTSGVVFAFADEVATDPQGRVHTFCHAVPGKWHTMGVMLSAGGALQWFRNTLCESEMHKAGVTGRDAYDYITDAAEEIPIGAEGLLFLPYLSGERTPHKDPYAKGSFIGLSLRHTKAHMARAVLEGVSFGMRDSLEIFREMGIPLDVVRALGGGGRSAMWRQMLADCSHVPITRINVEEGPSYGAAVLAGVAAGLHGSVEEASGAIIQDVERHEPVWENSRMYDAWYDEYKSAYAALAPLFKRTADLLR